MPTKQLSNLRPPRTGLVGAASAVALVLVLVPAAWSQCTNTACSAACSTHDVLHAAAGDKLSEEQIQKVLDWVMQKVEAGQGARLELQFGPELIAKETGVVITEENSKQLLPRLLAMLQNTEEGRALLASETQGGSACAIEAGAACTHGADCTSCVSGQRFSSRCAEYGACSLYGDLTGATGDVLEMYVREKATDGTQYTDFLLPPFEARDLDGASVASANLVGRSTVLVFLAGHCSHSFDTLPILQQLKRDYDDSTLRVVGVYINSGSVEDVASWIGAFDPEYEIWIEPTDALGDVIDSHLVPTYLLVDAEGNVRQKLVGYKTPEQVEAHVNHLIGATASTPASRSGD